MSKIEIKIVRARSQYDPGIGVVDFDEEQDAREWAVYAIRNNGWRAVCEVGETRTRSYVQSAVAVASPDGRVAVWYGRAPITDNRKKGPYPVSVNKLEAANAALDCEPEGGAAARFWDGRSTRGGDRDVSPLAMAALRVLHARAFEYPCALRDQLLAEFAALTGNRPSTPRLLRASDEELLAASALLTAKQADKVRALLARKGVAA